jgi:hypothetical protein
MVYLHVYDACDQISDFCHQQLLRKMRRKISFFNPRLDIRSKLKNHKRLHNQEEKKKKAAIECLQAVSEEVFSYFSLLAIYYTPAPEGGGGVYCFTSVLPSVQDIFRRIFLSNCWWQTSDIWSQASYTCRYTILWVAFLDPSGAFLIMIFKKQVNYIARVDNRVNTSYLQFITEPTLYWWRQSRLHWQLVLWILHEIKSLTMFPP